MTDGNYLARATEVSIGRTKSGVPQLIIKFTLKDGTTKNWYGSLKAGKGRDFTMNAVLTCGIENEVAAINPQHTAIEVNGKEVEIVVITEEYEGNSYQKIKWINSTGGSAFKELSRDEAVEILQGIDLRGELLAAKSARATGGDSFHAVTSFAPSEETPF